MEIPNGVKVGVAVVALAGAGFFLWKHFSTADGDDTTFTTTPRYFSCTSNHDFTTTAAEMRQISTANAGIMICPECKAPAVEKFKCPKCSKFVDFVGHGQDPTVCPSCKAKLD
ncbi:MAG: hypothetical protein IT435_06310 [Phycisphaerales bacterium]|nr:hypothetical protein [Phycisphaerales bacterium]